MEINLPVSINTEQLVESMIDSMSELQLRVFINTLCDKMAMLEFDEALLADRLRSVMPFYNNASEEGYEEPLNINSIVLEYPAI